MLPMKKKFLLLFISIIWLSISVTKAQNVEIAALRDSLDAIQYTVPSVFRPCGKKYVLKVKTQQDWDNLGPMLKRYLDAGKQNILVIVYGKGIVFGKSNKVLQGWNYPKANIRIISKKAEMYPYGVTYSQNSSNVTKEGAFYSMPCTSFALDDIIVDSKGNEIPIRECVKQVSGDILRVNNDIWKFQIDLPDLSESQCKDFYVLMTRDWTSARHKVVQVKKGWLYYHLDSEDLQSDRNPNVDWTQYNVRPRYRLINSPVSEGVHIVGGRIYIPEQYESIRINKGGQLITFSYCHFNSLEISGFRLNGCGGDIPIGIYSSKFEKGAFIHNNTFTNMSSMAISVAFCTNVTISNNNISNTRIQAIAGGSANIAISGNQLKKIGWMLNTRAITGGGEHLLICDNVIEDFNYGAIACGSTTSNAKATELSYIIERNTIRLNKEFTNDYIQNTLADGGGIYIGPQCTQGIIRNNVVENIKGIHSNRGIFLDDGAKNLAIYGNLILNTANSYDIDLRLTGTYAAGIPDHNTNNSIFQNIMTGGYRFQDAGEGSNCMGGDNVLLGTGPSQKTVVEIKQRSTDMKGEDENVETTIKRVPVDGFVKKQLKKRY